MSGTRVMARAVVLAGAAAGVTIAACQGAASRRSIATGRSGQPTAPAFYAVRNCVEVAAAGFGFRVSADDPLTGGRSHLTATTVESVVVGSMFDRLDLALGYSPRGDTAWVVATGERGRWVSADGSWKDMSGASAQAHTAAEAVNLACGREAPVVVTRGQQPNGRRS